MQKIVSCYKNKIEMRRSVRKRALCTRSSNKAIMLQNKRKKRKITASNIKYNQIETNKKSI